MNEILNTKHIYENVIESTHVVVRRVFIIFEIRDEIKKQIEKNNKSKILLIYICYKYNDDFNNFIIEIKNIYNVFEFVRTN